MAAEEEEGFGRSWKYCVKLTGGLLVLLVFLAGCSGREGKDVNSRVAASVNGVEITQREVDFLSERAGVEPASNEATLNRRRQILSGLVRSELLAQKASALKLDKTPDYIISTHIARRGVLAGLAERHLALQADGVSLAEASRVITASPGSFAGRKIVVYDEVLISDVDLPFLDSLNTLARGGASLEALMQKVAAGKKMYRRTLQVLPSDRIQPAILSVLSGSKRNTPVVARVGDKFSMIMEVHAIEPSPLTGEAALQAAKASLQAARRNASLSNGMADVLDAATVKYYGEFAPDANRDSLLAALPVPNASRVAHRQHQLMKVAVLVGGAIGSAMMVLAAMIGLLKGEAWPPSFAKTSLKDKQLKALEKYRDARHVITPMEKAVLSVVAFLGVAALGYQGVLVWGDAPLWGIGSSVAGGVVIGLVVSYLYARSPLALWVFKERPRYVLPLLGSFFFLLASVAVTMFYFH
ncbi:peptidyl-prolyl cis-trans isomerase, EpsD family [Chlorobium phaeovibrioides]|uniref:Peptidyl-prolyl cis-trans isomerase, EpsD family n=1 Tax=Chlorobium phaeovibrioides TaxID=1094 RepID=A0A5M8ICD5_CHLPH|nr:peptidyl-prolyl cis-trans isomerase, EpsD family [Chlorobium phaeovibrioides]